MSEIRWSTHAADDFVRIVDYIRQDSAIAAQKVARESMNAFRP